MVDKLIRLLAASLSHIHVVKNSGSSAYSISVDGRSTPHPGPNQRNPCLCESSSLRPARLACKKTQRAARRRAGSCMWCCRRLGGLRHAPPFVAGTHSTCWLIDEHSRAYGSCAPPTHAQSSMRRKGNHSHCIRNLGVAGCCLAVSGTRYEY